MEKNAEKIFELLKNDTIEQVITSVYYAVRIIRHIKHLSSIEDGFVVEGLITEPSSDEITRAKEILSLIQNIEQRPLEELNEAQMKEYIQVLADVLLQLAQTRLRYDPTRGRDLLYECRKDFYWKLK
jgi:hypothetical protein